MISLSKFFGSKGELEQVFREEYSTWLILRADHEAIYECYSIESDSGELDFALGIAVSIWGATPGVLFDETHRTLFVGFDSFIAAVPTVPPSLPLEHKLLRLDGIFIDMALLPEEKICVIHELGALVVTKDLTAVWSVSTDVLSTWGIDDERKILSLTEADSGVVIRLSTSTGAVLAP